MSSLRSHVALCLILLAVALGNPGCQRSGPAPGSSVIKNEGQSVATRSSSQTPMKLGPQDILISGEMLSLPKGVYASFDPDLRTKLDGGQPVNQAVVDRLLTDSRTRLILRPRLLTHHEESASFIIGGNEAPGIGIHVVPLLQPDGSVKLISFTVLNPAGRHSKLDVQLDQRVIHPAAGSYELIKGLKWNDDDVFFFIQVLTAGAVNGPDAGKNNPDSSR